MWIFGITDNRQSSCYVNFEQDPKADTQADNNLTDLFSIKSFHQFVSSYCSCVGRNNNNRSWSAVFPEVDG